MPDPDADGQEDALDAYAREERAKEVTQAVGAAAEAMRAALEGSKSAARFGVLRKRLDLCPTEDHLLGFVIGVLLGRSRSGGKDVRELLDLCVTIIQETNTNA